MTDRSNALKLVEALHGARLKGDLNGLCALFVEDGRYEIAGASADKPIAINADGLADFRPWLAMMAKVFRIRNYRLDSLVVEWPRIVAYWRADIESKVTGVTVRTELVDLLEVRDGRIVAYKELFLPR